MATQQTRALARVAVAPSVILLFLWMIVPLVMTIWFSLLNYNLQDGVKTFAEQKDAFIGLLNYRYFLTDPSFVAAFINTLILVGGVLIMTVGGGILLALLLDQPFFGQGVVRIMIIAPFFVMPTVSALIWKNLLMDPSTGFFSWIARSLGFEPIVWFTEIPLFSIMLIVAWQWLPFATLILLTAIQSLDEEQKEASQLDGAKPLAFFWHIVLPHLSRAITVVILIETIFLLNVFAEISVTTGGGPSSSNLPFLVSQQILSSFDVGSASAGGLVAVVLANIVAFFLVRMIGKNLEA